MNIQKRDTEFKVSGIVKNTAVYIPTKDDALNYYTAPTHGIIDGVIYAINDRSSNSLNLDIVGHVMKSDPNVIWVRIHHISYEGVDFGTW